MYVCMTEFAKHIEAFLSKHEFCVVCMYVCMYVCMFLYMPEFVKYICRSLMYFLSVSYDRILWCMYVCMYVCSYVCQNLWSTKKPYVLSICVVWQNFVMYVCMTEFAKHIEAFLSICVVWQNVVSHNTKFVFFCKYLFHKTMYSLELAKLRRFVTEKSLYTSPKRASFACAETIEILHLHTWAWFIKAKTMSK
jgi:hypothetical protein